MEFFLAPSLVKFMKTKLGILMTVLTFRGKAILGCIMFFILTLSLEAQTGVVKTYYSNRSIQKEISYINDIVDGSVVEYYQNGNAKIEQNYSTGVLNGMIKEFYPSGLLKEEYSVDHGRRDGIDRSYYDNGALKSVCKYSQGKLIEKSSFDFDSRFSASAQDYLAGKRKSDDAVYDSSSLCSAEICAEPIGGQSAIRTNLIYPDHALRYGLEGIVTLRAIIDIEGDVTATEILKGLGLGCDEAAEDAVKKTKFIPGQSGGKAVESSIKLNVEFKISSK
jgi:TonB family protein